MTDTTKLEDDPGEAFDRFLAGHLQRNTLAASDLEEMRTALDNGDLDVLRQKMTELGNDNGRNDR